MTYAHPRPVSSRLRQAVIHHRGSRLRLWSACLLLAISGPGAALAADETPSTSKKNTPTKAVEPGRKVDPRTFPKGVTVLVDGWKNPSSAEDFPRGVTVIGPVPTGNASRPVIKILMPTLPKGGADGPVAADKDKPPAAGQDLLEAPAERLVREQAERDAEGADKPASRPRTSVGPSLREQLDGLDQIPEAGAAPLSELTGWTPTDAWPDRDPARPYPWNPAQFAERTADTTWSPVSAYGKPDPARPYPWNSTQWSEFVFDPTWIPSDSWGRSLQQPAPPEAVPAGDPPVEGQDATATTGAPETGKSENQATSENKPVDSPSEDPQR